MPTVLRIGPHRYFFYSNENDEPPHIHVSRDRSTAKFWLDPTVILAGNTGFRASEINRIHAVVVDHREQLLEAWHEHFGN